MDVIFLGRPSVKWQLSMFIVEKTQFAYLQRNTAINLYMIDYENKILSASIQSVCHMISVAYGLLGIQVR